LIRVFKELYVFIEYI